LKVEKKGNNLGRGVRPWRARGVETDGSWTLVCRERSGVYGFFL